MLFFSVPTLASEGLLSYRILLSEQITIGVWNNRLQTELWGPLLRVSPVSLIPIPAKKTSTLVLTFSLCSQPGEGCYCSNAFVIEVEEQHCRPPSLEQKQHRTVYTVFQGWLLVPVSKSSASCRGRKISDQIPQRLNPWQTGVCCPCPRVFGGASSSGGR